MNKRLLIPMLMALPVWAEVDPCALLTNAEARRVFPAAAAGKVDRRLEKTGILYCLWMEGKLEVLQVRADQTPGQAREEVETLAMGISDPMKASNVRFEKLPGIDAVAVVEKADAARGISGTAAFVGIQKGDRVVIIASRRLPERERAAALKVLEDLARIVRARM